MSHSIARLRAVLAMLTVLAATAAFAAPTASAALTHDFLNEVGSFQSEAEPSGVAIDDLTGDVYVFDQHSGMVEKFTAAGAPAEIGTTESNALGPFPVNYASHGGQVAVDNSGGAKDGTLYVATGEGVRAFGRDGAPGSFPKGEAEGNLLKGSGGTSLEEAIAVAVDSKGDLYVGTSGNSYVLGPEGEFFGTAEGERSNALAVAPSGRLYDSDSYVEPEVPGLLLIKLPSTYPPEAGTSYQPVSAGFEKNSHGVAVDARSEHVMVLHAGDVTEYEPTGTTAADAGLAPVATFAEGELEGLTRAVGVDGRDGDVYVAVGTRVRRYGPLVKAPTVTTTAATNVNSKAGTATLNGTVDPLGEPVTSCKFEYGTSTAYGQTAPCAETPTGSGPQAVHADVSGLAPADYHFRLVAAGPEGSAHGFDTVFKIAEAPAIEAESATAVGSTEATLTATIDPGNGVTSYFFEYGTGTGYGSRTSTGSLPASFTPQSVSIAVVGLQPGTTYHFRAVATNEVATTLGGDQAFTTTTGAAGGGGCPNEALRAGYAALLPECRAYEMVSPVDKGSGEVYPNVGVEAAPSGESVAFTSDYAFAGAPANSLQNTYLSGRAGGDWATANVDPPQRNTGVILEIPTLAMSRDLGETLQASTIALAPGAVEGNVNLYLRDNATGARTLVETIPGESRLVEFAGGQSLFIGASANLSRVYLQTGKPIGGEGSASFTYNIYEFANGERHLVSRLPDGTPIPATSGKSDRVVSEDGHRLVFQQTDPQLIPALFLHEAGLPTVPISEVQRPGPERGELRDASTPFMSPDGSSVVFRAREGLAADAGAGEGTQTIYSFDTATRTVHQLISGPAGAQVAQIIATSPDNAYVYFSSTAALTAGASETGASGALNLYVWRRDAPAGEAVRLIGTSEEATSETTLAGETSPDGRSFAFSSGSRLTADDQPSPNCNRGGVSPAPCTQVFEYEVATAKLSCVTCGAVGRGGSVLGGLKERPSYGEYRPQSVFDGGLVYVETPNALSPRDSNGVGDVYQWRNGVVSLISTGTSEAPSLFADVAANGRDVFFKTSQPLVAQDTDNRLDLYDARVDGGIAAQEQAPVSVPCEGSSCRGPAPTLPSLKTGAAPECHAFAVGAKRATAHAKALAKKAKKAKGRRARRLRAKAKRARHEAGHLRKENDKCGRQGR